MPTEPHKLQEDPPEGSREAIEEELKRQDDKKKKAGEHKDASMGGSEGKK
jgi:hypothetical protein